MSKWENIINLLNKRVQAIAVPADLGAADIIRIHSEIDYVYSDLRVQFAQVKYQYENMKRKFSNAQKSAYACVKNLPKEDQPKNDRERDAWVVNYLSANPLLGMKIDIFTAMDIMTERYEQTLALIDILREKTERLSTMYGCIKLDFELGITEKPVYGAEKMLNNQAKNNDTHDYSM